MMDMSYVVNMANAMPHSGFLSDNDLILPRSSGKMTISI